MEIEKGQSVHYKEVQKALKEGKQVYKINPLGRKLKISRVRLSESYGVIRIFDEIGLEMGTQRVKLPYKGATKNYLLDNILIEERTI